MILRAALLGACGLAAAAGARAAPGCTPVEKWVWEGDVRSPGTPTACVTPAVVRLHDDNGDGRIDEDDTPDVVFAHQTNGNAIATGPVSAVDGGTGADLFTTSESVWPHHVSVADLDGDGLVEVLGHTWELLVFDNAGALKWRGIPPSPPFLSAYDPIGIADLDQDGKPEVYVGTFVFGWNGSFLWRGSLGQGGSGSGFIHVTHAVDLVPASPGLELLAGHTAYGASGATVWHNPSLPDGYTGVGDFDGDGDPEVVLVTDQTSSQQEVHLLDHLGDPLAPPLVLTSAPFLTPPVVADLDGDGFPEVVVASTPWVRALEWTPAGFVDKWLKPTNDFSSHNGVSAYDFDGDCAAEVLYHDGFDWYLLDGVDGSPLAQIPFQSATILEYPVVADIDHDRRPEILVSGCGGSAFLPGRNAVIAYDCDAPTAPRPVWNQSTYHVTNVRDDGSIPQVEPPAWSLGSGWLEQRSDPLAGPPADLGNTLTGVRAGGDVGLAWAASPAAATYALHRGIAKGVWPPAAHRYGLALPRAVLPDVPPPPELYSYRAAGVTCSGLEGP